MSAQPPKVLEGTEAPSQIEFLWERYRTLIWTVVAALVVALGVNYGWKYYNQLQTNETWSRFATTAGLDELYTSAEQPMGWTALADALENVELAALEKGLAGATDAQRPYLLLAMARKAMLEGAWERAESALAELENKYPNHSLVVTSDYPVQVREPVEDESKEPANPQKRPEFEPAEKGSAVSRMRAQLAAARAYSRPEQFAPIAPPADATKVKFEFSNGSSLTMAMMHEQAPQHVEAFLDLARREGGYWTGMAVDEIRRPAQFNKQPREIHLGYASTREDDRTKWSTTEPCEKPVEFEGSKLSHHPGAVSGRIGADGKSCADRFWIVGDDAPVHDGERVVFAYVTDGLDAVKDIAEGALSAQDEQRGQGRPTENVRVTSVTVIE